MYITDGFKCLSGTLISTDKLGSDDNFRFVCVLNCFHIFDENEESS